MKNNNTTLISNLFGILLPVMLLLSISLFSGTEAEITGTNEYRYSKTDLSSSEFVSENKRGNTRIEYSLDRISQIYQSEGLQAAVDFAAQRRLPLNANLISVTIDVASGSVVPPGNRLSHTHSIANGSEAIGLSKSKIQSHIEQSGGVVHLTDQHMMNCSITLSSLSTLSGLAEVRSIRLPSRPHTHSVVSEGVAKIGAHQYLNFPPYRSSDVKVCVIDSGFANYKQLLGTELPEDVTVKSFIESGDIEAGGRFHGTACAEIIHDIAPDAKLFFANIYWDSELYYAINWAAEQGVDLISYSMGSYWGPGNGTGFLNTLVEYARNKGITFVTSVGNSGDSHWGGNFNDPDQDGWHNFSEDDEILEFDVTEEMGVEQGIHAILKWNDWGEYDIEKGYEGATKDYDLYLFYKSGEYWIPVDISANRQPEFKWPWESTGRWFSSEKTRWGVAIRKINATGSNYFNLYIPVCISRSLEYLVPQGSITIPADSPYAISVGAVDVDSYEYEVYSSQGPTLDGRIKPDISAPGNVSTSPFTFGNRQDEGAGFVGSSAACPHVTGALALIKSRTPYSYKEIIDILYSLAIDKGEVGLDNLFGYGILNLFSK